MADLKRKEELFQIQERRKVKQMKSKFDLSKPFYKPKPDWKRNTEAGDSFSPVKHSMPPSPQASKIVRKLSTIIKKLNFITFIVL